MKLINSRYKLLDVLKKDVYVTTYIAVDLSYGNKKVLLHLLDVDNKDKKFIDFLINKFIKIASIKHVYIQGCKCFNVINTIDNKKIGYIQYFYTTEYAQERMINYKALSREEERRLFIQLCYALNYLHFRGMTYKLLNFENILIDNKGSSSDFKLRDVVTLYPHKDNINSIDKYNTQFVAPEIKLREKGNFSSDIYSLGVVLFYIISGLDYKENDFIQVFKKNKDDYMSRIIEKMTSPDPTSRYKSILEVVKDINEYISLKFEFFDRNCYEKLNFNIPIVNRKKEKTQALDYINGKLLGKSKNNSIFIHGEAGIGKSRFVKEIDFQVRMNKINVCSIELSHENGQMFYIYKRILRYIIKNNSINDDLISKYGSELVKILPELSSKWNVNPSETLSEDKEILRLNNRIYNFINDFTSKNPLLVIIDNIHHAHKNSLNILEYLIKSNTSLMILCTYTDEESTNISEILGKFKKDITTKFIQLTKLNFEEISKMLKNILGMAHKPLKLTTKIMEEANGNPRYVEEIVKSLFMDKKIIIDKERAWSVDIDDIYNLELPTSIDEAMLKSVNSLDSSPRNILDIISIFHSPVSLEIISKIIDIEEKTLNNILGNLVSLRIINQKFQDWGYSYDYYDKQLKKYIYSNICMDHRKLYHNYAANALEDFYISEGRDYTIELVYHLKNCASYDKAIKYCIKSAEKMEQLHIYNQAIVFYNRAIELLDQQKDIAILLEILMKMGRIYIHIGELDNAFETYFRVVAIANEYEFKREFIDGQNRLAYIYFYRNKKEITQRILSESMELSKELGYIDGELEGALQQCKLYAFTKSHSNLKDLLNKYISMSLKYSRYYYAGEFFNEKGKLYYEEGEMSKSQYCYEQSIFFFEKCNNNIRTTGPLNNIGIIYLEHYKEIEKAREYYFKALSLFEKYNYITDKGIYLINIGETYLFEDKYSDAIKYFNKAVDISIDVGDNNILFASYIHLCDTYLNLYQYDKAYFYLKKSESEIDNYSRNDIYYYDYYVLHIFFYIQIHNYSEAKKWYNSFFENIKESKVDYELELKIKELEMYKIQSQFQRNESINVDEIKEFLFENINKIHLRLIRNFLLDSIYFLLTKKEIDSAKYFIDFDANLIDEFNTGILDFKRNFILGLFSENKIEFYKNLLNKFENRELYEYEWRIFKALGDEYYKNNDYFNALSNYITALDILKSLAYRIPDELRENYVFNYDLNCILKEKIEDLKKKMFPQNKNESFENKEIKQERNLEEFFDFSDLNEFFRNKEFLKSVYNESREDLPYQVTELKELIQRFKKDELYNIRLMLKYCAHLCLAERGFVLITNDNNDIQEVISIGKHKLTEEIRNNVKNINHKGYGIIITNQNQFSKNSFNHNEIKSFICIPIKNSDQKNFNDISNEHRRKYENKVYTKEIVGYLYLDTKRVFNNFTCQTYEKCCSLINLLYIMIENYDLKKISSIDKLTNLYLRKHIEDLFRKEISASQKNDLNLSVIMCDIDKFKQVNDLYGHRKGDEVLENLGKILKNNLRKTDLAGRYGGEEFIVILPETDVDEAYVVCEKLRNVIENSKLMGNDMDLTLSFGISSYPIHGTSEEELVEKADQALYKSKKSGRNRTTVWNENIGYNKYRYDKLAGIITGNISTDHRNVNIIIDIIDLLKNANNKSDRLFEVLGYLIEISQSKYGVIINIEENKVENVYARERTNKKWIEDFEVDKAIVTEFINKQQGDYFIDWNEVSVIDSFAGVPNWNSYIIVPLIKNGIQNGILLLSVPIDEKEFDFNTFNLVNSLSGIIASML